MDLQIIRRDKAVKFADIEPGEFYKNAPPYENGTVWQRTDYKNYVVAKDGCLGSDTDSIDVYRCKDFSGELLESPKRTVFFENIQPGAPFGFEGKIYLKTLYGGAYCPASGRFDDSICFDDEVTEFTGATLVLSE